MKNLIVAIGLIFCYVSAVNAQVPPPMIVNDNTGKPNWVTRPEIAYDKDYYVSAVGYGSNRQQADGSAFSNLTAFFGQSVQSNVSVMESYKEQVVNGTISMDSNLATEQAVVLSSSMEQLIGAEVGARWFDEKNSTYYAVAIMEKPTAIKIYNELIDANLKTIESLRAIASTEKNTLEAVAKYKSAANIADVNQVFATTLLLLGGQNRKNSIGLGDDYRYEAENIAKTIPVNVIVEDDFEGIVKSAFSSALIDAGFRAGNERSRYVIEAKLSVFKVELNNPGKFARYIVESSFIDKNNNTILLSYSVNGREGHADQTEAYVRAVKASAKKISEDYPDRINEFLDAAK
jgi:hypothetical protein